MDDLEASHGHELTADPADEVAVRFREAVEALMTLGHACASVTCPGCDPEGERTLQVREDLSEVHDIDWIDSDAILTLASDVRVRMLAVTGIPHCHHHDDEGEAGQ